MSEYMSRITQYVQDHKKSITCFEIVFTLLGGGYYLAREVSQGRVPVEDIEAALGIAKLEAIASLSVMMFGLHRGLEEVTDKEIRKNERNSAC